MFGKVDIKARPLRLAYLIDPGRTDQAREAMRLSCSLWGGAYSPIIPLHKRMPATWRDPLKVPPAKSVILGYIDAFDPDVLVQVASTLPPYIEKTGRRVVKPEELWQALGGGRGFVPRFGIGVFDLLNDVFEEHFRYKAKYPFRVLVPRIRGQLSLFWTSVFGELPAAILEEVERHYAKPLEIETPDVDPTRLSEFMGGNVLFPRRLSQLRLNVPRGGFRGEASVFVLDASRVEDVLDFWNLRATGREVLPVPSQLKDEPQVRAILEGFLRRHRFPWENNPTICDSASIIRSRSLTMDEVQSYTATIKIDRKKDDLSESGFFSLQHWYPRIWDEWARGKDGASPRDIYAEAEDSVEIADATAEIRIKALLPGFADKRNIYAEARCANEVSFRFYSATEQPAEVFPQAPGAHLDRVISGLAHRGGWRVGRNGLVRLVQSSFSEHRDIPSAEKVLFAWLRDRGWAPELSASGILAKQIYRKLDGYVTILMNRGLLELLEEMNGGRRPPRPRHSARNEARKGLEPSIDKAPLDAERDLSVGEVVKKFAAFSERGSFYDYLLSKEIFKLGLKVQCPHCSRKSWFPLDAIRDRFRCLMCLNEFPAVGNVDKAVWSYKTTGPFSVGRHGEGAFAVLLTLHCFGDRKMSMLRTSPALSFCATRQKEKLEADLACLWQESAYGETQEGVLFAECKTFGKFEAKDFKRMRSLAKAFPGAVLVFSTLRDALSAPEVAAIAGIARAGGKYWKAERPINPVLVLTGKEVLSHKGAPYCWDGATQERFRHTHGLLAMCNASQQIYLKLPSWETRWHDKWTKKHQRARQRKEASSQNAADPPGPGTDAG